MDGLGDPIGSPGSGRNLLPQQGLTMLSLDGIVNDSAFPTSHHRSGPSPQKKLRSHLPAATCDPGESGRTLSLARLRDSSGVPASAAPSRSW